MTDNKFNLPLINTHTHAAMVDFRGMAEDLPLDVWLKDYIWPMEAKKVNADFVYKHTKNAIKEMKKHKIAAFCDMYFFEEEVAKAAIKEKIAVVLGETLLDFPTPSCKTANDALEMTYKLYKKYKNHPLIKISVAPHSIYTVNCQILKKGKRLAHKYNLIYQIHLAETKKEFDDCMKNYHKTPVEYLDDLGCIDKNTLLHHCVWLTDKDIKIISKRKASVSHCPLSNLKLGSGIAPINILLDAGVNVALATDGAASSNRLDIWEAGKIAALIQKGINHDPTLLPTNKIIEMMSVNGMKALHYKNISGYDIKKINKNINNQVNFNYLYHKYINEI